MIVAEPPVRIVKVGGSLLDWPLLKNRLQEWLAAQPAVGSVLIAGGGDLTDSIRRAQAIHPFDDEAAHWMCVQALSVTARLLATLLPDPRLTNSLAELSASLRSGGSTVVFDPATFLQHDEPHEPGAVLPHDWTATTDSIAARLAAVTKTSELVLLKSADPPPAVSLAELASAGYVDRHFPLAAAGLPRICLVNLRGESYPEVTLAR